MIVARVSADDVVALLVGIDGILAVIVGALVVAHGRMVERIARLEERQNDDGRPT